MRSVTMGDEPDERETEERKALDFISENLLDKVIDLPDKP